MIVATEPDRGSLVLPLVASAAVGGLLLHRAWRSSRSSSTPRDTVIDGEGDGPEPSDGAAPRALDTDAALTAPRGRWVVPVPRWQGRAPVISDGWGSPRDGGRRQHRGVDLMFRRRSLRDQAVAFPPRAPHSKWHFLPPGTLVLAAADADVWSAGPSARGHVVVLSHGAPWATAYRHLARLFVGQTARGASRERVRAGQPIGVVGADPTDARGIAHLHFEIWYRGGAEAAIDPAPLLRGWEVVDAPPAPAGREVS